MQLKEQRNFVRYEGDISTQKFGIVFNAKMAKILSDGLYSDKVLAVQRELSANAYDSHVAANNLNTPFEIKLPTVFDSTWYIRDYGTGLSPESVRDIYTNYGASDKEETNDQVGCLGLGSKSMFCIGQRTATIESFHNKKHYIYSAHLGEDGIPVLAKLNERDTVEPNGVKITIPVSRNDVSNFVDRATKVYQYFKLKPKFVGSQQIKILDIKYLLKGIKGNWGIRDTSNYGESGARAIMGNIGYPISFSDTNLQQKYNSLMNCPIDVFFEIGDLDIEASREGLSYDTRTKSNIELKFKEVLSELTDLIQDKIKASKTLWEARINFLKIRNTIDGSILSAVGINNISWNKRQLFDNHYSYEITIPNSYEIMQFKKRSYGNLIYKQTSHLVKPTDETKIFYCDLKTGSQTRCKYFLENGKAETVVLIYAKEDDGTINQKEIDDFADVLGLNTSDILPTSKLDKAPPSGIPRASRGTSTKVMLFKDVNDYQKTKNWDNSSIDLDDGGYFVELNTFDCIYNSLELHPKTLHEINLNLKTIGETIPTIYGIKTAYLKKLEKTAKPWLNYIDHIKEIIKKYKAKFDFDKILSAQNEITSMGSYNYTTHQERVNISILKAIGKHVTALGPYKDLIDGIEEQEKLFKDIDKIRSIVTISGLIGAPIVSTIKTATKLLSLESKIYHKYPLFHLFYNIDSKLYAAVAEYINKC